MKARVKLNNNYGHFPSGSIVEVDETELARVPWCLEAAGDEPGAEAVEAQYEAVVDSNLPATTSAIDQEQKSVASAPVAGTAPEAPAKKGKAKS